MDSFWGGHAGGWKLGTVRWMERATCTVGGRENRDSESDIDGWSTGVCGFGVCGCLTLKVCRDCGHTNAHTKPLYV